MFNINFNRLITWELPPEERSRGRIAWIFAITAHLRLVFRLFLQFRTSANWRATINGQVHRLRQALRQQYGNTSIQIVHPQGILSNVYIYQRSEAQTPTYVYRRSEIQPSVHIQNFNYYQNQFDFIVIIPLSLVSRAPEIYSFVESYKLAGKRFAIFSPNYPGGNRILP
jgi:hypothetical protein